MNLATIKNCIAAMALVGVVAFGADPAAASRRAIDVQASVADLKDALADLNLATTYFNSDGQPGETSILGGLAEFTNTLKVKKNDGTQILNAFAASSTAKARRDQMNAILGRLDATTAGTGGVTTLLDVFYYDLINSIRRISGPGSALQTRLTSLFGSTLGNKLYESYRLAVSRTR